MLPPGFDRVSLLSNQTRSVITSMSAQRNYDTYHDHCLTPTTIIVFSKRQYSAASAHKTAPAGIQTPASTNEAEVTSSSSVSIQPGDCRAFTRQNIQKHKTAPSCGYYTFIVDNGAPIERPGKLWYCEGHQQLACTPSLYIHMLLQYRDSVLYRINRYNTQILRIIPLCTV